ncbi:MAG: hypothetical protein IKJ74_04840 [Clostridia bacterium]|nr:hypothetical protein [Clostridia bacterium]
MGFRGCYTYIAKSTEWEKVEKELRSNILKQKERALKIETGVKEGDIEIVTRVSHIEKADGKEYYKCSVSYYNLLEYKNATIEELQENLANAKEELEELDEELEEIEDLGEDELGDFDFESQEEYEERLDELDDDIYFLKQDIEMIEKYLNEKRKNLE